MFLAWQFRNIFSLERMFTWPRRKAQVEAADGFPESRYGGLCSHLCPAGGVGHPEPRFSPLGYIYRYHTEIQVYPVTSMSERSPPLLLKNKIILATCGFSFGPAQSRWR